MRKAYVTEDPIISYFLIYYKKSNQYINDTHKFSEIIAYMWYTQTHVIFCKLVT